MKAPLPPVSDYIASVLKERDTTGRNALWALKEDELPIATRKALIEAFQLPLGRNTEILEFEGMHEMPALWTMLIYDDKLVIDDPEIEKTGKELRKVFLPYYEEICLKVFAQEMGYIYALYRFLGPRPLKANLQASAKRTLKQLSKNLAEIEKCLARAKRTPEWPYVRALIWEAYSEEKISKGLEKNISIAAEQFFDVTKWMNIALKRAQSNKDGLFSDYVANGRPKETRNNTLVALADSYHRCFNKKPTSTDTNNKPNFFTAAVLFLNFLLRLEGAQLNEDTKHDLIKEALRRYSGGSSQKKRA